MIPYYSPNLTFLRFLKSFLKRDAENKIISYFQRLADKKYILITNSCRTALYLAYKSIGDTGEVITSPLVCKSAINPIIDAGYIPVYCDILIDDLTMNSDDVSARISSNTRVIQATHIGGIACKMDTLCILAKKNNIVVVEDCAQGLGAKYKNEFCGSFGDIACFSLIKNAYGIGGGIFATNDKDLFDRACFLENQFKKSPRALLIFRVLRSWLESHRKNHYINYCYSWLMDRRENSIEYKKDRNTIEQLAKISRLEIILFAGIIHRLNHLHKKRRIVGQHLYNQLKKNELIYNSYNMSSQCSFTKFFVYNPIFQAREMIEFLNILGIEAKHLEQKYKVFYQEKIAQNTVNHGSSNLINYNLIHDHLISLPLCEYFSYQDTVRIIDTIKRLIK